MFLVEIGRIKGQVKTLPVTCNFFINFELRNSNFFKLYATLKLRKNNNI